MASTYFTLPSFARAKKNQEQLEKTNPKTPVLKDEDEQFLERHISQDQPAKPPTDSTPVAIDEDGTEHAASPQAVQNVAPDQIAVPEKQPDEPPAENQSSKPAKTSKQMELPTQEEAEAATNFNPIHDSSPTPKSATRTWAAYLPSLPSTSKPPKPAPTEQQPSNVASENPQRTWTEYASTYVPQALKPKGKPDADAAPSPVYREDGTIDQEATTQQQQREISVLLDNLNMTTFNDRVFALSAETQKIYDRFAQVLKDTINGVPNAYDDMDKLMREAGPTLEKNFKAMPPFVQTLVKSLPAKLSTVVGPEILAGSKLAEKAGLGVGSEKTEGGEKKTEQGKAKKSRRRVPGLRKLISQEGAVAGILRNVVNFIKVRFPFLASTTNVVMSLAVFILMFVFWYCHKRGREERLAKEAEEVEKEGEDANNSMEVDGSSSSEDEIEEDDKAEIFNQPHPSQIPLPAEDKEDDSTTKAT